MPRRRTDDQPPRQRMNAPEPDDKAFVRRVRRLVQEADDAAREQTALPTASLARKAAREGVAHKAHRRSPDGTCVGCGCPRAEINRLCETCRARDYMRTYIKVVRLCKMIEASFA